jgi:transposase
VGSCISRRPGHPNADKENTPLAGEEHGGVAPNNRLFMDAVLYVGKTGIPWRDLPAAYGRWDSVYHRFNRWCKKGRGR